jgi:hypothetical protein
LSPPRADRSPLRAVDSRPRPAAGRTAVDGAGGPAQDHAIVTAPAQEPAMRPIKDLTEAVTMPLRAVFVVGLCWAINAFTYQGTWWVKWVALGMGIATVVALARGLRTAAVLLLAAWAGRALYRRYGPEAKARFDEWMDGRDASVGDVMRATASAFRPAPPRPGSGEVIDLGDATRH